MQYQSIPFVSIITPSFNQGQFIEETILSVLNQTYKNIQYIVVDGGSTDHTMEVVNKYRDRIDIIIHQKDKGQTDAINKGFKLAKGELVGWINSDDILYPDCVEKIVQLYINNPLGSIFYSTHFDVIDKSGNKIKTVNTIIPNRNYLLNIDYKVVQQASFYKTDIVKKVDFLDENICYCMDLDLWLKLLKFGNIYGFENYSLCAFRTWEEAKTTIGRYRFFREIRKTLLSHKALVFSPNIRRTCWYEIKDYAKRIIGH